MNLNSSMIIALVVGALFGLAATIGFRLNSKKQVGKVTKELTGLTTNEFINYTFLGALSGLFIVFTSLSFIERDTTFPMTHPIAFLLEAILIGVIPAALFVFVAIYFRGYKAGSAPLMLGLLSIKFILAHLLLQFSGYYSYVLG